MQYNLKLIFRYQQHRILNWFREDAFQRLFLNTGKLLGANGIAIILGFIATALTARLLGPENYGIFALALVYQVTISRLVSFNGWQALIKYGAECLHRDDLPGLRQLIKIGFCVDIGTAVFGAGLALFLSDFVVYFLGWQQNIRPLLLLSSVTLLFSWNGTPVGLLRLYNRFEILGGIAVFSALVRLAGVGWCLLTSQDVVGFILIYVLSTSIGQLFQTIVSLWVCSKNGVGNFIFEPVTDISKKFPGIWDYIWTTNFHSSIRMLTREADEIFIAGLTDPLAFGLFKIAKQFSRLFSMLIDPLTQSIYPELTRLWVSGDKRIFLSIIKRTTFFVSSIAIGIWFAFVLSGNWLVVFVFGTAYRDAYSIAVVYMLALILSLSTFSIHPTMLAIGRPRVALAILMVATCVYFAVLFFLLGLMGIIGAAISYLIFYIVWIGIMLIYLKHHINDFATSS